MKHPSLNREKKTAYKEFKFYKKAATKSQFEHFVVACCVVRRNFYVDIYFSTCFALPLGNIL